MTTSADNSHPDCQSGSAPALIGCKLLVLLSCLMPMTGGPWAQEPNVDYNRQIIVAIEERPEPAPLSGSTSRGYGGLPSYSGNDRTRATSARLAREYDLTELAAWTIDPLRIRCMLFEIAPGSQRKDVLARLQQDRRVHLAQALRAFSTLSSNPAVVTEASGTSQAPQYTDPYVALQTGFVSIGAAQAQRLSNGDDVRVALIDTGVDATHPDLDGRIDEQRDFVGANGSPPVPERHATEVAGVIAAVANNGVGIVGVAPGVRIHSYRACWPVVAGASAAHCNSFTLAQALAAAIESKVHIINLSLGGPHDALLEQLLEVAFKRGVIVVGATPASGLPDGFPSGVSGVIAVRTSTLDSGSVPSSALSAPGEQILTLEPGGSYDYASGSSLATAHVAGTIALLLQLSPGLDASALTALLRRTSQTEPGRIDACAAVHSALGGDDACVPPDRAPELRQR